MVVWLSLVVVVLFSLSMEARALWKQHHARREPLLFATRGIRVRSDRVFGRSVDTWRSIGARMYIVALPLAGMGAGLLWVVFPSIRSLLFPGLGLVIYGQCAIASIGSQATPLIMTQEGIWDRWGKILWTDMTDFTWGPGNDYRLRLSLTIRSRPPLARTLQWSIAAKEYQAVTDLLEKYVRYSDNYLTSYADQDDPDSERHNHP